VSSRGVSVNSDGLSPGRLPSGADDIDIPEQESDSPGRWDPPFGEATTIGVPRVRGIGRSGRSFTTTVEDASTPSRRSRRRPPPSPLRIENVVRAGRARC